MYIANKNSNEDFLELYRKFDEHGILEADEENNLILYLQNYIEGRFDFIDKDDIFFEYCEFLKKMGIWYWD